MAVQFQLVVPCFNEAPGLENLILQTIQAAREVGLTSETFQLVLVDNGSVDGTRESMDALLRSVWAPWVKTVLLDKNQGYGGGVLAGLKTTEANWVGWIHADLQVHPSEAFRAWQKAKAHGTLVKGRRRRRTATEYLISRGFELAVGYYWGYWGYEINAQPKVFPRSLVEKLEKAPTNILFDAHVLKTAREAGFQIESIRVRNLARTYGASSWSSTLSSRLRTFRALWQDLKARC